MTTYILMVQILGGEPKRYRLNGVDYETTNLAEAMGQKATVEDEIRQVFIVAVTTSYNCDLPIVLKTFELVNC